MRKYLATFILLAMMVVMLPFAANAQTRYSTRRYYRNNRGYSTRTYYKPSFYRRHRNAVNIGVGTGAGALLGGIFGGRRGAGIGALAGAGGSALYTYKIRPKRRRY